MLAGSCVGIPCPPYIEFIRRSEKAVGVRTTQRLESHQFVGGLEGFMYSETKWRENRADAILITCQIYAERAIVANTRRCVNILDGRTYFVCGIGEHWDCRKGNFTSLIEEGSVDQANVGVFNVSIANVWTIITCDVYDQVCRRWRGTLLSSRQGIH